MQDTSNENPRPPARETYIMDPTSRCALQQHPRRGPNTYIKTMRPRSKGFDSKRFLVFSIDGGWQAGRLATTEQLRRRLGLSFSIVVYLCCCMLHLRSMSRLDKSHDTRYRRRRNRLIVVSLTAIAALLTVSMHDRPPTIIAVNHDGKDLFRGHIYQEVRRRKFVPQQSRHPHFCYSRSNHKLIPL